MSAQRYPVHRLVGGSICRQDVAGGRWIALSPLDAAELLARLDGFDHRSGVWRWTIDDVPRDADIFHHPV